LLRSAPAALRAGQQIYGSWLIHGGRSQRSQLKIDLEFCIRREHRIDRAEIPAIKTTILNKNLVALAEGTPGSAAEERCASLPQSGALAIRPWQTKTQENLRGRWGFARMRT
jgi:hypothetical protein